MAKHCDGGPGDASCTPGCFPPDQTCEALHRDWFCSYSSLYNALASVAFTWNELVVDTASVEASLPGSILAFFSVPGSDQSIAQARGYRDTFAGIYDVRKPVVQLDTASDPPFALDSG